jgi:hypothetical protein
MIGVPIMNLIYLVVLVLIYIVDLVHGKQTYYYLNVILCDWNHLYYLTIAIKTN